MAEAKRNHIWSELQAIRAGNLRTGLEIGRLLALVEETEYWREEGAPHFTDWLTEHAADFRLRVSMMWSNYRAARAYENDIRPFMKKLGLIAPPVEELGAHVSPEAIDLLRRIKLAAPEDVVRTLAKRVVGGTVRRTELRDVWHTYREVVKADPHRKGRIITKNFAGKDRGKLLEAEALDALQRHKNWTGAGDAIEVYRIFREIRQLFPNQYSPDALLIVKPSGGPLEIHGLEVKTSINERLVRQIDQLAPYFDRYWIVLPRSRKDDGISSSVLEGAPYVGIVEADNEGVTVIRPAGGSKKLGGSVLDLSRTLLAWTV